MSAIDALLTRLDNPKLTGRDRWRCACPVCGGRNQATLSIGIGDTGALLLKCWKSGCGPEQIAHALGLELTDLFPPREQHGAPARRRALLSARQAIDLIEFEISLVRVAAINLAHGHSLTDDDLARLGVAGERIQAAIDEVRA